MSPNSDRDQTVERLLASIERNSAVDRRDALAVSITEDELAGRLESGLLVDDGNGAYRVLGAPRTDSTAHRLALISARGLAVGWWSALHAHGTTRGSAPDVVHVLVDWDRRVKKTDWYCPHRTRRLEPDELTEIGGEPFTTMARTIRDLAAGLPAKPWADRQLIRWTEESLMQRTLKLPELELLTERERGARVRARLRKLVYHQNGDDLSDFRSLAETWLRDLIRRRGLPEPQWNVKPPGFAKELDTYWVDLLIVEFDGFTFHHTRTKHDRDRQSDRRHLRRRIPTVRITKTDFQTDLVQLESDIVFFVTGIDDRLGRAA